MELLSQAWAIARHVPVQIRHFLALTAPAIAVIVLDRWIRRRA